MDTFIFYNYFNEGVDIEVKTTTKLPTLFDSDNSWYTKYIVEELNEDVILVYIYMVNGYGGVEDYKGKFTITKCKDSTMKVCYIEDLEDLSERGFVETVIKYITLGEIKIYCELN